MISQDLLTSQKAHLTSLAKKCLGHSRRQSDGFALRILGASLSAEVLGISQFDFASAAEEVKYGGFPSVAYLGFGIASQDNLSSHVIDEFLGGLKRLQERPDLALVEMATDDVALLGIADGLSRVSNLGIDVHDMANWLLNIINRPLTKEQWSSRMRQLSGDLLDRRGRLRVSPDIESSDALSLDIALRSIWMQQFIGATVLQAEAQSNLLRSLLLNKPLEGDLESLVIKIKAIDILVDSACRSLLPTIPEVSRLLSSVQHSMKRWVWRDKPRRTNTAPARWLIDEESDVQSLLWAILYPMYGSDLVDERYLPNWGSVQPRIDLGIIKLRLIIEVKMARKPSDFVEFEGQIGSDLGLYFKDTSQFDRMIVFIYDDCDEHHPEKHDSLRNALMKRERIEDVVIMRRPGMIPNRDQRS
jgi:hypothetical protein